MLINYFYIYLGCKITQIGELTVARKRFAYQR